VCRIHFSPAFWFPGWRSTTEEALEGEAFERKAPPRRKAAFFVQNLFLSFFKNNLSE